MEDNEKANRPVDKIPDGNLKASIWRNESEKGSFYSATFTRSYKDPEGNYRDTQSFTGTDLLKLSELARRAYARTNEFRQEDYEKAQSRENRREDFKEERGESSRSRQRSRDR